MLALDTNALVRLVVEDEEKQSEKARLIVNGAEKAGERIIILTEVLVETVWVLESVYKCTRDEIKHFLRTLTQTSVFTFSEPSVIASAILDYGKGADFADSVIVEDALYHKARTLFSFDKKLQKRFPGYVVEDIDAPH